MYAVDFVYTVCTMTLTAIENPFIGKGRRFVKEGGSKGLKIKIWLEIPFDMTVPIHLHAGWAVGYDTVKITPTLRLFPQLNTTVTEEELNS